MIAHRAGIRFIRGTALVCVLGLVVAGGLWWVLNDANRKHVTAYFPEAIGLYEGNDVRMLGVEVGTITDIDPQGDRVRVDMDYDRQFSAPADARATIVASSLVSDRYVQLGPAHTDGPALDDWAVIPMDRTAVPLEIDELSESLSDVSESLGPEGAGDEGSLSHLLTTLSENMEGNGERLNQTIEKLSQAAGTASGSSEDLFGTVDNLAELTTVLADSDDEVRAFENQLAEVSSHLSDERQNLAETVQHMGTTLESVDDFVEDNRDGLKSNVDKLSSITRVLSDERSTLAEILDIAPLALSNLINTYNAASGTLDARPNLNELTEPPLVMVCGLLKQVPEPLDGIGELCEGIAESVDDVLPLPSLAQSVNALNNDELPPLPLPVMDQLTSPGESS